MEDAGKTEQKENGLRDILLLVGVFIVASCFLIYSLFTVEVLNYKDEKISINTYKIPLYGWLQQITEVLEKEKEVSK